MLIQISGIVAAVFLVLLGDGFIKIQGVCTPLGLTANLITHF